MSDARGGTRQGGEHAGLLGREVELARLDRLLEDASAGRSGVLVVRGEAGVGKTALLDYAAGESADMRLLRTLGLEAESKLPFAGMERLVRPVLGLLPGLPDRQAAALRAALALGEDVASDRFAVYVATFGLLAAAAEERPLLALVDDAHWLDDSSAEALLFAARRLDAEGIALVFAARTEDPDQFDAPDLEELRVEGLAREAATRLLELHAPSAPAPEVAERLVADTRGNPLALIELGEQLGAAELAGEQPLAEPLASGDAARRAFLRRAAGLSPPARWALLVAAAAGDGEVGPLLAALAAAGIEGEVMGQLEAAGLIVVGDGRLEFRHPLVRAAVYAAADANERRAAHRALADAFGHRPERRAWHLAATALGPDEQVAEALQQAAETARRRTGFAAAAQALERAALLTPPGQRRVERLLAGADAARQAGRPEHALRLLRAALEASPEPRVVADITYQRGRLEWYRGRPREAQRLYLDAARLSAEARPVSAAWMLIEAALAAYDAGQPADGLAIARRARAAAGGGGGGGEAALAAYDAGQPADGLAIARRAQAAAGGGGDVADAASAAAVGVGLYWSGEAGEAHRLLSRSISMIDRQPGELPPELASFITAWRVWTGVGADSARPLLARVIDEARAAGALGVLPYALAVHARMLMRDGDWPRSYADASEAAEITAEIGSPLQRYVLLGYLALIEAAQGRERDCRAHADEALALAHDSELGIRPTIGEALGLLELGLGRPQEALRHLERATAAPTAAGNGIRLARPSLGDLVEADLRSEGAAPKDLLAAVARAGQGDFDGSQAVVARCLALVAPDDQLDSSFARALELHGSTWPFERARTQLSYGERLRRVGRRVDARTQLREALESFEQLGARPWAERAATELRATGERIRRRDPTAAEQLTPQELQIALTVSRGATNREAGASLFLSHKTIEHHLSQIYRKLGLRSRTELARALHDAPAPQAHTRA